VSPPIITNRIEITMATIGRLMKNFDMVLLGSRLCHFGSVQLRFHLHASPHLLRSFGYDAVAWLQSFRNDPLAAEPVSRFNRLNRDSVFVIHDGDLVATLQFGDGALRPQQCILFDSRRSSHPPV